MDKIAITALGVNLKASDLVRSQAFYEALGFQQLGAFTGGVIYGVGGVALLELNARHPAVAAEVFQTQTSPWTGVHIAVTMVANGRSSSGAAAPGSPDGALADVAFGSAHALANITAARRTPDADEVCPNPHHDCQDLADGPRAVTPAGPHGGGTSGHSPNGPAAPLPLEDA
jgi:hypothetical protein